MSYVKTYYSKAVAGKFGQIWSIACHQQNPSIVTLM